MNPNLRTKLENNLGLLYGRDAVQIADQVFALADHWSHKIKPLRKDWTERDTFLITYGDSLTRFGEPGFLSLKDFLHSRVIDSFSFIHILPFYPWTSDAGFSVVDFREVKNALGDWGHLQSLKKNYRLVFDCVINHVSQSSAYVKGHLEKDPRYIDFCIEHEPTFDDSNVTRPRTGPLYHAYQGSRGKAMLWTTFSEDQVDLNYTNPKVLIELLDVLLFYASKGASMIRLDAIAYMWKESGTNCVHRPQTHAFIRIVRILFDLAAPHVNILSETNVPHYENLKYFGDQGDESQIIYNFTLAPLILYGLTTSDAEPLNRWAKTLQAPFDNCTFLNITSTHDGIGMRPTEGILTKIQRKVLTDLAVSHGGAVSSRSNPDGSESPYELNITFFDAINDPNDKSLSIETQTRRFLVSQAIPMALVGIPAIYMQCLLGSRNNVTESGIKREINRGKLNLDMINNKLDDPESLSGRIFAGIKNLLDKRQSQSAFHPNSENIILDLGRHVFAVWRSNLETGQMILALHNLSADDLVCSVPKALLSNKFEDILDGTSSLTPPHIILPGYGIRWLLIH